MKAIRIGTRKSPLALWQAQKVAQLLQGKSRETEIVPVTSDGDINLKQPIYRLGLSGVFTRSLDIALLNDQVDIAVHSLKDVPTDLPEGIELKAYLERANPNDILVYKSDDIFDKPTRTIATGSLRRKAFWLRQYPNDEVVDLRGNVQLRLQKLLDNEWDGAVFAFAGLDRSEILEELKEKGLQYTTLDWMISAPSQGIIAIAALKDFELPDINNKTAEICAKVERQFLKFLEGGCTAPIGALVTPGNDYFSFKGAVLSLDGSRKLEIESSFSHSEYIDKGKELAEELINQGAKSLIEEIKIQLNS